MVQAILIELGQKVGPVGHVGQPAPMYEVTDAQPMPNCPTPINRPILAGTFQHQTSHSAARPRPMTPP